MNNYLNNSVCVTVFLRTILLTSIFYFALIDLVSAEDGPSITPQKFVTAAFPNTFFVESNIDVIDENVGDGICHSSNEGCTLRAAIMEGVASGGADIYLTNATYSLTIPGYAENNGLTGDLDITDGINIFGVGKGLSIIDGNGLDRVLDIGPWGAGGDFTVTLQNLTIRGGSPVCDQDGGGIINWKQLILLNVSVADNTTNCQGGGGGIWNEGSLLISETEISNNIAPAGQGGGITNRGHAEMIDESKVHHNIAETGGGISNSSADDVFIIQNSDISSNFSASGGRGGGGGILHSAGHMFVSNSQFRENHSVNYGGGISILSFFDTTFHADHVTFTGNRGELKGGAIFISDLIADTSNVILEFVTISNNQADVGGGIYNEAFNGGLSMLSIRNSTLSNNIVRSVGGGLFSLGDVQIADSTIVENRTTISSALASGVGVYFDTTSSANVSVERSLIAKNDAAPGSESPDCVIESTVSFMSLGYNLLGQVGTLCEFTALPGDQRGSVVSPIDPKIGPLQDNGGFNETHGLYFDSPAIDAAGTGVCGVGNRDQRDAPKPTDGNFDGISECDIGAFEFGAL